MISQHKKGVLSAPQKQKIGYGAMLLVSLVTVVPIIALLIYIFQQGFSVINWEFISAMPRQGMRAGGILPAIMGTIYLTLGTALFSIPPGVAAAIYLAEYAPDNRFTRLIRIA